MRVNLSTRTWQGWEHEWCVYECVMVCLGHPMWVCQLGVSDSPIHSIKLATFLLFHFIFTFVWIKKNVCCLVTVAVVSWVWRNDCHTQTAGGAQPMWSSWPSFAICWRNTMVGRAGGLRAGVGRSYGSIVATLFPSPCWRQSGWARTRPTWRSVSPQPTAWLLLWWRLQHLPKCGHGLTSPVSPCVLCVCTPMPDVATLMRG